MNGESQDIVRFSGNITQMPNLGKGSETVHLYVYWEMVHLQLWDGYLGKMTMAALKNMDLALEGWISG